MYKIYIDVEFKGSYIKLHQKEALHTIQTTGNCIHQLVVKEGLERPPREVRLVNIVATV
jgi:hypothetical protein